MASFAQVALALFMGTIPAAALPHKVQRVHIEPSGNVAVVADGDPELFSRDRSVVRRQDRHERQGTIERKTPEDGAAPEAFKCHIMYFNADHNLDASISYDVEELIHNEAAMGDMK